ncbi:hypothetical protein [Gottfriedia luciferensis]|uniref:hypothetical protein n=1 Tax=Gottfriedia luciferensis TaxID=178774 RepID=UPI000B43ECD7|nr:hypothetical protein [Gottfriedia luciferensis]
MDKSSKISIKINGEEKEFKEGATTPQDRVEKNEEFGWVLPTPDGIGKKVIVLDDVKKKKNKPVEKLKKPKKRITFFSKKSPSKSIIISIISASLIGICFGFVFLGIFKQSKPDALSPTNKSELVSGTVSQGQAKIPLVKFDLAQVGMFKSMESAKKNVKEVSSLGYSPIIYEKNNAYFVVIALSGKDSTFLADEVKKKLKSAYLKEETVAGEDYKGPKHSVDMYKAEVETFSFMLSYLTQKNYNNEKQLEQISSTMLILSNQKDFIKNKQLLKGLKNLQNIEKVLSTNKKESLNKVTESVQSDMLSLFKILKEQKNTLTN